MRDFILFPPGDKADTLVEEGHPSTGSIARTTGGKIHRLFLAISFAILGATHAEPLSQEVVDEINFARTQPQLYAQILAARGPATSAAGDSVREAVSFLQKSRPLAPLSWSSGLSQAALNHALDTGPRGGRGHIGTRGDTPWERIVRFGTWEGYWGENIDYGHSDPRSIVISLIIDEGVPGRGHRTNLFNRQFRVAGVGVGPHANFGTMCVMDFAARFTGTGEEMSWEKCVRKALPANAPWTGITAW